MASLHQRQIFGQAEAKNCGLVSIALLHQTH